MSGMYQIRVSKSLLPWLWIGSPLGHDSQLFNVPRKMYAFSSKAAFARAERWCRRHAKTQTREIGVVWELPIKEKP